MAAEPTMASPFAHRRRDGRLKLAYDSKAEAERFVGPGENAYRCTYCDQWHIGHTMPYGRPQLDARLAREATDAA